MNNKTTKTEIPYAKAVVIPPTYSEGTPLLEVPSGNADNAGEGRWKDGLCSCFRFGLCHTSLLSACCIPQLLMAQVLNRVSLDYLGRPITNTSAESKTRTFRIILGILIAYFVFYLLLACPPAMVEMKDNDIDDANMDLGEVASITDTCPAWQRGLNQLVSCAMFVYTVVVMTRLRKTVRNRYHIPTNYDTNMEDCCYATWCGCCTVSQLARQTADYDVFAAHCCSTNGLSAAQEDAIAPVV